MSNKGTHHPKIDPARLLKLKREGLSNAQIGARLGVDARLVANRLRKMEREMQAACGVDEGRAGA